MRFTTTVELGGKTATGFVVPEEVVAALGSGERPTRRPPVVVTINGHSYRSTIAVYGGVSMLPLSAPNREAAGVRAGQEIEVEVELDTAPRTVEVPPDLAAALAGEPGAQTAFDALSFSRRREHVLAVEGAKSPETRQRRIDRVLEAVRSQPG